MSEYSDQDIIWGTGVFYQAMRSQSETPGWSPRIDLGGAIGIISAAIESGLPKKHFTPVIDRQFGDDAPLIKKALIRFEGGDWDTDLWREEETKYKLCTALRRPNIHRWRYYPHRAPMDS